MNKRLIDKLNNLNHLIGNTLLLEIDFKYKDEIRKIFAKAEYMNLTGSIKDRMAFHIINEAYKSGELFEGDQIVEATSGNTGIAFSAIGSMLGHDVTIFMPNWMSDERKNLIKSFGAQIRLVTPEEGGFLGSIKMSEEMKANEENVFLPRQFSNKNNAMAHFLTTGPEIWEQMNAIGRIPNAVVAGVGTGGTIMGTGSYLKEKNPQIRVYPLEPSNSPTMTTGYKIGKHRIQGISDEFIPELVKLDQLDEIISVDDGDAIIMAQKLSKVLGLGLGISSGANFLGAIIAQEKLGKESNVVTIFSDDNKKYLSTDLMKDEIVKDDFISKNVALLNIVAHKRAF